MPKLDFPLQLSPILKPKIWGRKELTPLFPDGPPPYRYPASQAGEPSTAPEEPVLIGEAWLTDQEAKFLNGPVAGLTLGEVCREYGPDLCGKKFSGALFPVLAKYLFTSDWLSLQVHPDDQDQRVLELGTRGKCEMWYIVEADDDAEFLLGLKPGVTKERLRAALMAGTAEELVQRFTPAQGEAIFLPPGTVHALGPGLVLFEAEQHSDMTYRLYDYGRRGPDGKPRPLHLEDGLRVTRPELPPQRDLPRLEFEEAYGKRRYVVASAYFGVEELTLERIATFAACPERVETLSIISGEGRVETSAGWYAYRAGDTWLIPPATPQYRLVAEKKTRLLKFYVPDLERDFRQPLKARGVPSREIDRTVLA